MTTTINIIPAKEFEAKLPVLKAEKAFTEAVTLLANTLVKQFEDELTTSITLYFYKDDNDIFYKIMNKLSGTPYYVRNVLEKVVALFKEQGYTAHYHYYSDSWTYQTGKIGYIEISLH